MNGAKSFLTSGTFSLFNGSDTHRGRDRYDSHLRRFDHRELSRLSQ